MALWQLLITPVGRPKEASGSLATTLSRWKAWARGSAVRAAAAGAASAGVEPGREAAEARAADHRKRLPKLQY